MSYSVSASSIANLATFFAELDKCPGLHWASGHRPSTWALSGPYLVYGYQGSPCLMHGSAEGTVLFPEQFVQKMREIYPPLQVAIETVEVTMEEVCRKFGKNVKIVKGGSR